jgi:hypothetical protein
MWGTTRFFYFALLFGKLVCDRRSARGPADEAYFVDTDLMLLLPALPETQFSKTIMQDEFLGQVIGIY